MLTYSKVYTFYHLYMVQLISLKRYIKLLFLLSWFIYLIKYLFRPLNVINTDSSTTLR